MGLSQKRRRGWFLRSAAAAALVGGGVALAGDTQTTPPVVDDQVIPAQQRELPEAPGGADQPAPRTTLAQTTNTVGFRVGGGGGGETGTAAPPPTPAAETVTAGQIATQPAGDLGEFFNKSGAAVGVEVQRRSGVVTDTRVRGYRIGQLVTYGDGGFFFPARLDLDTAVSKFDPGSIENVNIIKGPYSVRYGPGFAFLDIITKATPRYDSFEVHERSYLGYQTNGGRLEAIQSFWGGDKDWGFRVLYNLREGDDYRAGHDVFVPSSYSSQNANFAVGYSLTEDSRIEFKGLRLYQHDVLFPGVYFDINRLDTEAYNLRYTFDDREFYRAYTDLWYNDTAATGDTHRPAKQTFLNSFLTSAFRTSTGDPTLRLADLSDTSFNEISRGYRTSIGLGPKDGPQIAVGTDFNYVTQALAENIRILQLQAIPNPNLTQDALIQQQLGIPHSHLADPGVFLDGSLPVGPRFTARAGVRADWVNTNSDPRLVTGNVLLAPGTSSVPGVPGFIGQPPVPGQPNVPPTLAFNPIVLSSQPNQTGLERNFNLLSTFVNADYKIDPHVTASAAFGYAERPPTMTELYAAGPFIAVLQQGLNRLVGDPNLQPERVKQFDIGLTADYEYARGGASGFYAWIDNYITFDQQKGGGQINQVVFTNTNVATLSGGELYGEADLMEWLTPFATASYVQGRDLTHIDTRRAANLASSRRQFDTEPLPGIPPLELRGGFRVHEASKAPRWSVEFMSRSVMGQNLVASSLGEVKTSGFTIFDVRAYWQATNALLLTSGVENIGDKFYREHLDPIAGFPGDQLFRPGTNFYVSAQIVY